MADEDNERELDLEESENGEVGGSPKRSKKKLIIIAVAALLVLGGGGGGAYFFLFMGNAEVAEGGELAEEEEEVPKGEVEYLELKPAFIVNFPSRGRQRFLQASVTLMSRDPDALLAVTDAMPIVRHNLINLLSAQSITLMQSPAGIEELRLQATKEVQRIMLQEIGREGIEELLFTAFVMQ